MIPFSLLSYYFNFIYFFTFTDHPRVCNVTYIQSSILSNNIIPFHWWWEYLTITKMILCLVPCITVIYAVYSCALLLLLFLINYYVLAQSIKLKLSFTFSYPFCDTPSCRPEFYTCLNFSSLKDFFYLLQGSQLLTNSQFLFGKGFNLLAER